MQLDNAAEKILNKYTGGDSDTQAAIDPAIFGAIIQLLPQLLQIFQNCQKGNVPAAARNPGFLTQRIVKNQVRRHLGLREYRRHGDKLVQAIFEAASDATPSEIEQLYDDLEN